MKSIYVRALCPVTLFAVLGLMGCDGSAEAETLAATQLGAADPVEAPACQVQGEATPLPAVARETSGLAAGSPESGVFWTHNDAGNEPDLYAIDLDGGLAGTVRVEGAELEDWEDIESGPCEEGRCLFIGDIGDNDGERDDVVVYRIREPAVDSERSELASALRARYPDGPRDAEGLFIHPTRGIHLVTKGRRGPVELYRFPAQTASSEAVTLERVGQIFPYPSDNDDRITAATASPDGRWVAMRSYRELHLFNADQLTSGALDPWTTVDLSPLGLEQGESLAITSDGVVWMTSEAESDGDPQWARVQCTFP